MVWCNGRTLLSKLAAAEGRWEADKAAAEEAWAKAKQQVTAEWTAATVELEQQQHQKLDAQRVRFEQVRLSCAVYQRDKGGEMLTARARKAGGRERERGRESE